MMDVQDHQLLYGFPSTSSGKGLPHELGSLSPSATELVLPTHYLEEESLSCSSAASSSSPSTSGSTFPSASASPVVTPEGEPSSSPSSSASPVIPFFELSGQYIPQKKQSTRSKAVSRHAADIVRREAQALLELANRLDSQIDCVELGPLNTQESASDIFAKAVNTLNSSIQHGLGKLVLSGIGKSGLLAKKAVATFNSLGIPSVFLHPVEALHGDLGLISPLGHDSVILVSYSGKTSELLHLTSHLRRRRIHSIISVTKPGSPLALAADLNLDASIEEDLEADEHVPAPTSSVMTAMALLDALALCMLRERVGWHGEGEERKKAFKEHHPGGALGQQLQ